MPLLGIGGGVHVGGLDVAPLLAAIAGMGGVVGVHVGGLDVVALLAAIDGCHCWGWGGGWVHKLEDWMW